jgi:hypothetical protein
MGYLLSKFDLQIQACIFVFLLQEPSHLFMDR